MSQGMYDELRPRFCLTPVTYICSTICPPASFFSILFIRNASINFCHFELSGSLRLTFYAPKVSEDIAHLIAANSMGLERLGVS